MSGRVMFTCKPLSLSVVAAIATLSASSAEALLLPPKPLALSSSWDCKSNANNDWLCRSDAGSDYNQPLENVSRQSDYQQQARNNYQPASVESASSSRRQEYNPATPTNDSFYNDPYQAPSQFTPQPTPQSAPAYPQQPTPRQYREAPIQRTPARQVTTASSYQPAPIATPEIIGLNRLLNASHGSYVLQWLAAHSPKPLQELQNYYPVLQEAAIVQYRRNNKDWYVLLDGPFKDRNSAMTALKATPRSSMINKLYPWTRSIASIQKLDLIRPDVVDPGYEQNVVAEQYSMPVGSPQPTETMFASIAPAYPNIERSSGYSSYESPDYNTPEPASSYDYNTQFSQPRTNYTRENRDRPSSSSHYSSKKERQERTLRSDRHVERKTNRSYTRQEEINRVLNAPSGSYTIQWLASSKQATLERAKQRFPYLDDAQIVQYRKRNRVWYVLVSPAYTNVSQARTALEQPAYARIATRLYPRLRSVDSLRKLVITDQPAQQQKRVAKPKFIPKPAVPEQSPVQDLLTSSDGSYTIQWFAANKPESINKMKQRFPELASAVTVHYRRNQKDWYVLLQGQYDSSSEALSIIKSPLMQDAVRVLHPWTRPVTSLKKLGIQES